MNRISRRQFLVGGGAAATALSLAAVARSLTESAGPDSTFSTPPSGSASLPLADPTFVGNSDPTGGGNGVVHRSTPMSVMCVAVNANGQLVSSAAYTEDGHRLRAYDSAGVALGQYTQATDAGSSGMGNYGFYACAADATYAYATHGGAICRWGFAAGWGPSSHNPGWLDPTQTNISIPADAVHIFGNVTNRWFTGLCLLGSTLYACEPGSAGFTDGAPSSELSTQGGLQPSSSAAIWAISTTWSYSGGTGYAGHNCTPSGSIPKSPVFQVPYARHVTADREGNLWVLQQPSIADNRKAVISRWTTSGKLLQQTTLGPPASIYPTHIWADPKSDTLLVCDNARDQNIKKYAYDVNNVKPLAPTTGGPLPRFSTIGLQNGYLDSAHGTPGALGAVRFCGLRAAAVDSSGNVYVAQSGLPGVGDQTWANQGPLAIISKLNPSGTEVWRSWAGIFGGEGEPSAGGGRFYEKHFAFTRRNTGVNGMQIYGGTDGADPSWQGRYSQYLPSSFTADPWTYAKSEDRVGDGFPGAEVSRFGRCVWVADVGGFRYLVMFFVAEYPLRIYQVSGEIAIPRVVLNFNGSIVTNGSSVAAPFTGGRDWWVERSTMNVWVLGPSHIYRLRFQGAAADGTPQYSPSAIDKFPYPAEPSELVQDVSGGGTKPSSLTLNRIEVHGDVTYLSGFMKTDPHLAAAGSSEPNGVGRHIWKYASLPTTSGYPAARWRMDLVYASGGQLPAGNNSYPNSWGFDDRTRKFMIGWRADGSQGGGTSGPPGAAFPIDNGRTVSGNGVTGSNPYTISMVDTNLTPPFGQTGQLDNPRAIQVKNGYAWVEDDWAGKAIGINMANR